MLRDSVPYRAYLYSVTSPENLRVNGRQSLVVGAWYRLPRLLDKSDTLET